MVASPPQSLAETENRIAEVNFQSLSKETSIEKTKKEILNLYLWLRREGLITSERWAEVKEQVATMAEKVYENTVNFGKTLATYDEIEFNN